MFFAVKSNKTSAEVVQKILYYGARPELPVSDNNINFYCG